MTEKDTGLPRKEEWILPSESIDIDVRYTKSKVLVQFEGFDSELDAEEYATTLAEVLPILLHGSTRIQ